MKKINKRKKSAEEILYFLGIQLFFTFLIALIVYMFIHNIKANRKLVEQKLNNIADVSSLRISKIISSKFNAQFRNLEFLKNDFFNSKSGKLVPDNKALIIFKNFKKEHPDIAAINIQNELGNKIVWSSLKQTSRPIISGIFFSPLKNNKNKLIGQPSFAKRNGKWLIPMRIRIKNFKEKTIGFIGSPFILSSLKTVSLSNEINVVVIRFKYNKILSVWKNGIWEAPSSKLPKPPEKIISHNIPDYPFIISAYWTKNTFNKLFWEKERPYFIRVPLLLFLFIFLNIAAQIGLSNILRLKSYQAAVIKIEKEILSLKSPEEIYGCIVNTIVSETCIFGAFVAVPCENECLKAVAVKTFDEELENSINNLRWPIDKNDPLSIFLPCSVSYRENKIMGPKLISEIKKVFLKINNNPSFSKIKTVVSLPISENQESTPFSVLVVFGRNLKRNFNETSINLLQQIVYSAGMAIKQIALRNELSKQALYDQLTGLPNRRFLELELERIIARAARRESSVAVAILDLDNFKHVNDIYGHETGDYVLKTVSDRLKNSLRKEDFVARLGGDEFVLIFEHFKYKYELENIFEKIGKIIKEPIEYNIGKHKILYIGLSMGVRICNLCEDIINSTGHANILRYADSALYQSKEKKYSRLKYYVFHGESVMSVENGMQKLLRKGRVEVFYQPILENVSRKIVGVEALARLKDKDGLILTPDKFLSHLKDEELFELTKQVFSKSLSDIEIIDKHNKDLRLWVSVNLAPSSLNNECLTYFKDALSKTDLDPQRITFEMLEGGEFLDKQDAIRLLSELRSIGVKIALDDVGSAYSSLLRMRTMPIDKIKLDQTFVRTLEEHLEDLNFVLAIQDLAENFNFDLVVEGVETNDILDALTVLNAGFLQGYAIAKPMPLEDLLKFIEKSPAFHIIHPVSLMGIYIEQIIHQNSIKKMVMSDPELLNDLKWKNADFCIIGKHLRQIGIQEGSPLDNLHRDYHKTVANLDINLIKTRDPNAWNGIYAAQENLLKGIYEEHFRLKTG